MRALIMLSERISRLCHRCNYAGSMFYKIIGIVCTSFGSAPRGSCSQLAYRSKPALTWTTFPPRTTRAFTCHAKNKFRERALRVFDQLVTFPSTFPARDAGNCGLRHPRESRFGVTHVSIDDGILDRRNRFRAQMNSSDAKRWQNCVSEWRPSYPSSRIFETFTRNVVATSVRIIATGIIARLESKLEISRQRE